MNKAELITAIATKTEGTKKDADKYLSAVVESITDALVAHDKVSLVGFGTFEARHRDARVARNPQTGEEIQLGESYVPAFRAGKALKDAVKNA